MTDENGDGPAPAGPAFRRTDRTDAPYYLARYAERRGLKQAAQSASTTEADADAGLPLYLRRFRERGAQNQGAAVLDKASKVHQAFVTYAGFSAGRFRIGRFAGSIGRQNNRIKVRSQVTLTQPCIAQRFERNIEGIKDISRPALVHVATPALINSDTNSWLDGVRDW